MVERLGNTSMDLMRWRRYSLALPWAFAILGLVAAVCDRIKSDCPIGDAVRKFAEMKLQAFPVVDAKGNLRGIVDVWRLLHHVLPPYIVSGDLPNVRFAPDLIQLHERLASMLDQPLSVIMNQEPPTVRPDNSVLECATLMLNTPKTVHLLPVEDESGRVLGVIAPLNLIKEIA